MRRSLLGLTAASAAFLFAGACHGPRHPTHGPDLDGNPTPIQEAATVAHAHEVRLEPYESVEHLYRNAKSQLPSSVRLAIMDTADWTAVWKRIVGSGTPSAAPNVDFSREMLLVVGMGQAPCMGYQINVDTVFRDEDKRVYAVVRERHHGSRCGCLNEVVSPVDVVRVPRTLRPVTFLERRESNVCEER